MKPTVADVASEVIAPCHDVAETWRLLHEEVARYRAQNPCNSMEQVLNNKITQTSPPRDEVLDRLIEKHNRKLDAKIKKITHDFHESIHNITCDLPKRTEDQSKAFESLENPEDSIIFKDRSDIEKAEEKACTTKETFVEAEELPVYEPEDLTKHSSKSWSILKLPNLQTELQGFDLEYLSSPASATASKISENATETPVTEESCSTADQPFSLRGLDVCVTSEPLSPLQAFAESQWTNGEDVVDYDQEPSPEEPIPLHWSDMAGGIARLEANVKSWFGFGATISNGHGVTVDDDVMDKPANPTLKEARHPSKARDPSEDGSSDGIPVRNSFLSYLLAEYDPAVVIV